MREVWNPPTHTTWLPASKILLFHIINTDNDRSRPNKEKLFTSNGLWIYILQNINLRQDKQSDTATAPDRSRYLTRKIHLHARFKLWITETCLCLGQIPPHMQHVTSLTLLCILFIYSYYTFYCVFFYCTTILIL